MDPDLVTLLELETAVWNALGSGDSDADESLLSESFLGVYPSGFATRADHVDQLAEGATIASFEIVEPRVVPIAADSALLAYRAKYQRTSANALPEQMYVTSLWQRLAGSWQNTFSQDTPCDSQES